MFPKEPSDSKSISLCMIVRDEEACLPDCLTAVRGAVDEMIVVDTGSRDATPELARTAGARVLRHTWTDDFAAARNVSLAAARGTFCLYIDADEILRPGTAAHLRRAVADPRLGGGLLRVVNDHGSYRSESHQIRLFRRLPGVRFEGPVHEQIAPTLRAACAARALETRALDVVLDHSGYNAVHLAASDKLADRLRLLRQHLEQEPGDIYLRFKLAELLHEIGDKQAALVEVGEAARRARACGADSRDLPCLSEIPALLGLCLHESGQDLTAYRLLLTEAEGSDSANLHFVLGMVAHRLGDLEKASAAFLRCLDLGDRGISFNRRHEGITSFLARTGLGAVAASRGAAAEARRWLEAALDENPACEVALRTLVELVAGHRSTPSAAAPSTALSERVAARVECFARHPAAGAEARRRAAGWLVTLGFAERARSLTRSAAQAPAPVRPR